MHRTILVVALAAGFITTAIADTSSPLLSRRMPASSGGRPTEWLREQTILEGMRLLRMGAGVPIVWEEAPGPLAKLHRTYDLTDADVLTVLNGIVTIDPRYSWRESNGVIVVRPTAAWSNPENPLNQRVESIAWRDLPTDEVLVRTFNLLFTVEHVATSRSSLPRLTITVPSGSILDILIAATRSNPQVFWSARYNSPDPEGPRGLALGYLDESTWGTGEGAARALYSKLPKSMSAP